MVTRRGLLRRAGALAAVGAGAATAGCNGDTTEPTPDQSTPAYAAGLYDPGEVLDATVHGFTTYNLGAVYENRDLFPEDAVSQVEAADEGVDAVSLAELDRFTAQVYADATPLQLLQGRSVSGAAGGTALLTGSFDPEGIAGTLRGASWERTTVEESGSAAGHTLYTVEASGTPAAVALSDGSLGVGATTEATDTSGEGALRTALTTEGGYYGSDGTVEVLVDTLGTGVATSGLVGNFGAPASGQVAEGDPARPVVTGLRAVGSSVEFGDDGLTSTVAGVYAEGETPSESELRALVDRVGELAAGADGISIPTDEVATAVDGRAATLSVTQDPEAVFELPAGAPGGVGSLELLVLAFFPAAVALLGFAE